MDGFTDWFIDVHVLIESVHVQSFFLKKKKKSELTNYS